MVSGHVEALNGVVAVYSRHPAASLSSLCPSVDHAAFAALFCIGNPTYDRLADEVAKVLCAFAPHRVSD
jgi:hypothetical protein